MNEPEPEDIDPGDDALPPILIDLPDGDVLCAWCNFKTPTLDDLTVHLDEEHPGWEDEALEAEVVQEKHRGR